MSQAYKSFSPKLFLTPHYIPINTLQQFHYPPNIQGDSDVILMHFFPLLPRHIIIFFFPFTICKARFWHSPKFGDGRIRSLDAASHREDAGERSNLVTEEITYVLPCSCSERVSLIVVSLSGCITSVCSFQ